MRGRDEAGFSLIELVVVVAVLSMVISAIAGSLVVVIRTTGATAARSSQSHDAQLLATWLVPDLQSSADTPVTPTTAPPPALQVGACPAGAQRMGSLLLSWTDAASGTSYSARYEVDTTTFVLRRTFTVGTAAPTSMVVAHHLQDPRSTQPLPAGATARYPVCYQSTAGRTTLTVTTLVNRDATRGSEQYAFDVTVQNRTPFGSPPPPAPAPPALTELVSLDINPQNGKVDTIVATFDQSVACTGTPSCDAARWAVTGQPGAAASVTPTAVVTSANTVALSLAEPPSPPFDTAAAGMAVTLQAGSVLGSGGPALFTSPVGVLDGMPPLLASAVSADGDGDGRLDGITLTFTEALNTLNGVPRKQDIALSGAPPGSAIADPAPSPDPDPITGSGAVYTVPLTEATAVNTQVTGMRVRLAGGAAVDLQANGSPLADLGVGEGMPPVLDASAPPIVRDDDGNGRADHVIVTFTEPLAPFSAPPAVWSLTDSPSGATVATTAVTPPGGSVATITLAEGTDPPDTTAAGFRISLSPDPGGIRDGAGNQSSFSAVGVADRMAPALLGVETPPGALNVTPGEIEPLDSLALTFTEAPATVPLSLQMEVEDLTGPVGTSLTITGLADVAIGPMSHYTVNKLTCDMLAFLGAGNVVTLTVVGCTAGAIRVTQADAATATVAPTLTDGLGNKPPATPTPLNLGPALYF